MTGVPSIIGFIVVSIPEVVLNLFGVTKMLWSPLVRNQILLIFCADSSNCFGINLDRKIRKADAIDG